MSEPEHLIFKRVFWNTLAQAGAEYYAALRNSGLPEDEAIHAVRSAILSEYERLLHGGVPPAWKRDL